MFVNIPATEMSISFRRTVYGVGINDADYMIEVRIDGKRFGCPYYRKWQNMLMRCYDPKFHEKHPTYKDCFVCDEWLTFSNFRKWMESHDWEGKHLDKDIFIPGNKEYSPDKCLFVSQHVNKLFGEDTAARGICATGVWKYKNKYCAEITVGRKKRYLGLYETEKEAREIYKKAKYAEVVRVAFMQPCKKTAEGLIKHALLIIRS